ncbi:MAG: SRPBCC family protein [Myxococcota bacterium]
MVEYLKTDKEVPVIHQEVQFQASPAQLYRAFMDAEEHAAFTGGKAEISSDEGGSFSCHDGQIEGRNIELVPGSRIVQAWRVAAWPEGLFTIVRIQLEGDASQTTLTLDHSGVPDDFQEHIAQGWEARYWSALKKHFA